MRNIVLFIRCIGILLTISFFNAAIADAPHTIVIKFSHVVSADTPKGKAAMRFKELAERRTAGRVQVEVFPNGKLFKDKEEFEALRTGEVQMLAPAASKFGALGYPLFELFDLPFLFKDDSAFHALADGPLGTEILQSLQAKGVQGLAFWDNAFQNMTANIPLRSIKDFKGLKIRTQGSRALDSEMRLLGASPQSLPFNELYQSLLSGKVDASEGVASNLYTQKIYEVQKYFTFSNHGHLAYVVIANKSFWGGLPPEIRTALQSALKDASAYANGVATIENLIALEKIRASNKTTFYKLTDQEANAWKAAVMPIHDELAARIGYSLVQAAYHTTGFELPK